MIARAPGPSPDFATSPWLDPAADGARSVLFPEGTVYVGDGRFWHRRTDGTVDGPL
jgi:hypothetical protein